MNTAQLSAEQPFTGAVAALDGLIQQAIRVRNERNTLKARNEALIPLLRDCLDFIENSPVAWGRDHLVRKLKEELGA